MLNVLFVSHWFPRTDDDWNGVFVLEQARALRAAGVDVRVLVAESQPLAAWRRPVSVAQAIARYAAAPSPSWTERRGVPVVTVPFLTPHPRFWGGFAPKSYDLSLRRWWRKLGSGFRPHIVHAHTAFLDGYAGLKLSRRLGVPLVITEGTGPFKTVVSTPAQKKLTSAAVRGARLLLPVSGFQREAIQHELGADALPETHIIGNGVDPTAFPVVRLPEGAESRFLWVGRLECNKQPLMLLAAFEAALASRPEFRLTIIGTGPMEADIAVRVAQDALAGKVRLLPPARRADIPGHLREHGTLIISSVVETFGVIGLEALVSGRNLLTTRCGGPEEIVARTGAGIVVANTAAELSAGILRSAATVCDMDPRAVAAGTAAIYGYASLAARIAQFYRQITGPSGEC